MKHIKADKKTSKIIHFRVVMEQDEDGVFVASVPALPGCHTEGDSYEEAITNIKEAIELCLEVAEEDTSYRDKISINQNEHEKTRFLGVADVPVQVGSTL